MSDGTGGPGSPPRERMARQRASGVAGSRLSAPAAAALRSTGLEAAGEVMGCIVMHLGWKGFGCGYVLGSPSRRYSPTSGPVGRPFYGTVLSSERTSWRGGLGPYVRARYHAYDTALQRLAAEVRGLGADGALGVRLTWTTVDGAAQELAAVGTAVRWRSPRPRRGRPFLTELDAESVAAALSAGWAPVGIVVGISAGIRHMDAQTSRELGSSLLGNTANVEVHGVSRLVRETRADARTQLELRARPFLTPSDGDGRSGHLVVSRSWLNLHEEHCDATNSDADHVAEAGMLGTLLDPQEVEAARREPRRPLAVLPVTR